MGFFSSELERFKEAIASQGQDTIMLKGYTNAHNQTKNFRSLKDVRGYLEYLEDRADREASSSGRRPGIISAGYGGR